MFRRKGATFHHITKSSAEEPAISGKERAEIEKKARELAKDPAMLASVGGGLSVIRLWDGKLWRIVTPDG